MGLMNTSRMPVHVIIQWGRAGIQGVTADATGNSIRLREQFSHAWPDTLDVANDAVGVGKWLKSKIGPPEASRLIVLVPREEIVLRLLTLPEADEENLPDLVRYQTAARSSVPLDQMAVDYVQLTAPATSGGRWVQVATLPAERLQHMQRCAEAADLTLSSVGVTTWSVGELIRRAEQYRGLDADGDRLVIRQIDSQLEISLWRGADLLFAHVAQATDAQAVLAQVQRALMSHQAIVGEHELQRTWLLTSTADADALSASLASRLGVEVIQLDAARDLPATLPVAEMAADLAKGAPAWGGLLASWQVTPPTIDFLQPRRAAIKQNQIKTYLTIAALLVAVLLPATYFGLRLRMNSLRGQIAEKQRLLRENEDELKAGEPVRDAVKSLAAWQRQRVDWLEQMQRMTTDMPGTERLYLDRWRFDRGVAPALGSIEADGFARDRQDVQRTTQRLAEQPGVRIRPNPIGSGGDDPEYPILYQLDAELVTPSRSAARDRKE